MTATPRYVCGDKSSSLYMCDFVYLETLLETFGYEKKLDDNGNWNGFYHHETNLYDEMTREQIFEMHGIIDLTD